MSSGKLSPRQCRTPKCGKQTRHTSKLCVKCRYSAVADKAEVRYEVAVAKPGVSYGE